MDPKGIGAALLSGIPIIGSLASAALQRHWAKKDLAAQNKYNSPAEQLRRLKQAGLPAASFFSGGVSSQSEQPRSTNVNPDLGTSEVFSKFTINAIEKLQLQMLQAQVMGARADARLKDAEAEWWLQDIETPGQPGTHKPIWDKFSAQKETQVAEAKIKSVTAEITSKYGMDLSEQELLHDQTINNILRQQFDDMQIFLDFKRDLQRQLRSKGEKTSTLDVLENLLGVWLMGQSTGRFNIK